MRSVLPRGSLRGLRAISTAGMGHTARQVKPNRTRQPNGEYSGSPTLGDSVCCLHTGLDSSVPAEVAAAQGWKATGKLKFQRSQRVQAGTTWEIDKQCDDAPFLVEIVGDLVRSGRTMRLVAVRDVVLDR